MTDTTRIVVVTGDGREHAMPAMDAAPAAAVAHLLDAARNNAVLHSKVGTPVPMRTAVQIEALRPTLDGVDPAYLAFVTVYVATAADRVQTMAFVHHTDAAALLDAVTNLAGSTLTRRDQRATVTVSPPPPITADLLRQVPDTWATVLDRADGTATAIRLHAVTAAAIQYPARTIPTEEH